MHVLKSQIPLVKEISKARQLLSYVCFRPVETGGECPKEQRSGGRR
jgi:hypothetical protein